MPNVTLEEIEKAMICAIRKALATTLRARITALEDERDEYRDGYNRTELDARCCPGCVYRDGVFIKRCYLHETIDAVRAELAAERERWATTVRMIEENQQIESKLGPLHGVGWADAIQWVLRVINSAPQPVDVEPKPGDLSKQTEECKDRELTRLRERCERAEMRWAIVDELRSDEGDSVEILCDNADFNMGPNNAILCCGPWLDWKSQRFECETLDKALTNAVEAKRKWPRD